MKRIHLILALLAGILLSLAFTSPAFAQSEPPPPPPPSGEGPVAPPAPPQTEDEEKPDSSGLVAQATPLPDPWIMVGATPMSFTSIAQAITAISGGIIPTDRTIHVDAGVYDETNLQVDGNNVYLGQLQKIEGNCDSGARTCNPSDPTRTIVNGGLNVHHVKTGFTLQGMTFNGGLVFGSNTGALMLNNLVVTNPIGEGISVSNQRGAIIVNGVQSNGNAGVGASLRNDWFGGSVTVIGSTFSNNAGLDIDDTADGLSIKSIGLVTLDGVTASRNDGDGVLIQTRGGIIIRNSQFNDNNPTPDDKKKGYGLVLDTTTSGNVLIENSQANRNELDGLLLRTTAGAITLRGTEASGNGGRGLAICLPNVDGVCELLGGNVLSVSSGRFTQNHGDNAWLLASGLVTVASSTFHDSATGHGLYIRTRGPITVIAAHADNNHNLGAYLDNCWFNPDLNRCTGAGTVSFLPSSLDLSQFNNNGIYGLRIISGSVISLNGVRANGNVAIGIQLDNSTTAGIPPVNLNRVWANNNGTYGLDVYSRGAITWSFGEASGNGAGSIYVLEGVGARLINREAPVPVPVTITAVNIINNRNGDGLSVLSKGNITLNQVEASGNQGTGALLRNDDLGVGLVVVNGLVERIYNFDRNELYGLEIYSRGVIILANISTAGNLTGGAFLDNAAAAGMPGVTMVNARFDDNPGVGGGLYILSRGTIVATNLSASNNGGTGAVLSNTAGTGWVIINRTLAGSNDFSNNTGGGLMILSKGNVLLTRMRASENFGSPSADGVGLYIDNCQFDSALNKCLGAGVASIFAPAGATNEFANNADRGLSVFSSRAILLQNPDVHHNAGDGIYLDNRSPGAMGGVSLATVGETFSRISNNQLNGLLVYSRGPITLVRMDVRSNLENGACLDNAVSAPQPVSVTQSIFSENKNGDGLIVNSLGTITLVGVDANQNDVHQGVLPSGATVSERVWQAGIANADIWTLTGDDSSHTFTLAIDHTATLRLERWNAGSGSWETVDSRSGFGTLTLTGTLNFDQLYRVLVIDDGPGEIENYLLGHDDPSFVRRTQAGANGAELVNNFAGGNGAVIVTGIGPYGSQFSNNSATGLAILTRGGGTLSRVKAIDNGDVGAWIDACSENAGACQGFGIVTFRGLENVFARNRRSGLVIDAFAAVYLDNTTAFDNGGDGIDIDNHLGTGGVTITATNPWMTGESSRNAGLGLRVSSRGPMVLIRITAYNNSAGGALLENNGAALPQIVRVIDSTFSDNPGANGGLTIHSKGGVFLDLVRTDGNTAGGAVVENHTAATAQSVTVQRGIFSGNAGGNGLRVLSKGFIVINGVEAHNNAQGGVYLDNCLVNAGACDNPFTNVISIVGALGQNSATGNQAQSGWVAFSRGNITLARVYSKLNAGDGLELRSWAGAISVTDATLIGNARNGMSATADTGDILLALIRGFNNGPSSAPGDLSVGNGVQLWGTRLIRLIGSTLSGNSKCGVRYHHQSSAPIVLITTVYFGNVVDGAPGVTNLQTY